MKLFVLVGVCGLAAACGSSGDDPGDGGTADGRDGGGGDGNGERPADGGGPDTGPWQPKACPAIYAQDLLPTFEMEIDPAEWDEIVYEYYHWEEREAAGLDLKPYHPLIAFRYGAQTAADAMVRLRGNPCCSWTTDKFQMQISFNENDPDGRFLGLRKIALDAPRYNKSLLRQRLALAYLRDLGVEAPCSNHARLNVNGEYYGLFENLEKVDREFLERNFPDPDGNLFKKGWELETNEDTPDYSRNAMFWDAQHDLAEIERLVDLDQAVLMWASDALIPNNDGYWAGGGNFYLYDDPTRGKFVFIPWDIDSSFEVLPADTNPLTWIKPEVNTGRPHYETVIADPAWRDLFLDDLERSLVAYDPAVLQERIDTWDAQIRDALVEDPNKPYTIEMHDNDVEELRAYVQARADWVREWIPTVR
jgi:hypothetical protein